MMNIRRKLLGIFAGLFIGVIINVSPRKAYASAESDLFEKALQYIANIIIKYYAGTWYNNTKDQMEDWGSFNGENTVEEENRQRVDFAKMADSMNATNNEIANKELMAATEPTPIDCMGENANSIKLESKKAIEMSNNAAKLSREHAAITLESVEEYYDQDFDVKIDSKSYIETLATEIDKAAFMLLNNSGLTATELAQVKIFIKRSMPRDIPINMVGESFRNDRNNAKIASRLAKINIIKAIIDEVLTKKTKNITSIQSSSINDLGYFYRGHLGLSDSEVLMVNVEMFTRNSELIGKMNGTAGFINVTPILIVLCEMKSVENVLWKNLMDLDSNITKLLAIEILNATEVHDE
jgi:hypothetical protein